MPVGVILFPRSDMRTNPVLKIPSFGGPPRILFQTSIAACSKSSRLAAVYLLNLT